MANIYIIRNSVNKKCYIGQTIHSIEHRLKKHKEKSKRFKSALYSAFDKYGFDKFYTESLKEGGFTREELNKLEIDYIKKYKTLSPNGYNLQGGGGSSSISEETKAKMSKIMRGRKVTWGKKVSIGLKRLWENEEYRKRQTKQRYEKRGKYRKGIIRLKLRKQVNIKEFKTDYLNYMTSTNLSKKHEISVPTVYRIIKRENINKRGYKCNKKD